MNFQTTAAQRSNHDGHWDPLSARIAILALSGAIHGLTIREYMLDKDSAISIPFTVNAENQTPDSFGFFKFVNELDSKSGVHPWTAWVTTGPNGTGEILGVYSGRSTTTDEQHARYRLKDGKHGANPSFLDLLPGTYYYNFTEGNGAACGAVVGHQNN